MRGGKSWGVDVRQGASLGAWWLSRGALRSRCVFVGAVALLAVLALSSASAVARTLSAEPSGGGFVENPDHTWTLYGDDAVRVYSAAEKETFDRVWHAEEFDLIPGRASGHEVTGISVAEEEAAQAIINRMRTGRPYVGKGEQEVGEGYMRTVEEKGIISKRAEVLFGGILEKEVDAGTVYAPTITIAEGLQRMFTMPAWHTEGALSGIKEYGELFEHPIKHRWGWANNEFELITHLMPCTSISYARGVSERESCAEAGQGVELTEEVWDSEAGSYRVSNSEWDRTGGYSTTIPEVPVDCVTDDPYPSCNYVVEDERFGDIGLYLNATQLESSVGEPAFPAGGLNGHRPSGLSELLGENINEPGYNFGEHREPISVSNPALAPVPDELEIAYALQASLLPGLEGGVAPDPAAPGESPTEPGQNVSKCGEPVACATGSFGETQTDLSVGGRGVGLNVTRTYSSQAAAAGVKSIFGYGWSGSFTDHLVLEPALHLALLATASGATVPFAESGGSFTAPASSQDKLSGSAEAGYTLTLPNQARYKFSGSSGRLEKITDRDGNETTLSYGGGGLLEAVTDSAGRRLTFAFNAEGYVESVTDPMGHKARYTYENGTLATVTLPGEETPRWRFKVDGSHQITEMTDGRGGKTVNKYNANHQVEEQADPLSHALAFEYGTLQTKITNKATGAVTFEQFTPSGEPASITRGYGTSLATTESWEYNAGGYETLYTDGKGHSTEYGYESEGNRTSEKNADGDATKWEYDHAHDVISETSPMGEKTTIEREAHGNPTKVSRPGPHETTQVFEYRWTSEGELESYTNPLHKTWTYEHDSYGDETGETDPRGDKRTWSFNEDSQETKTVSPRGNASGGEPAAFTTTIERDQQGRPTAIIEPELNESAKPLNVTAASVVGAPIEGTTLTAAVGLWRGIPSLSYSYQWQRCNAQGAECANISGATASTHAVVTADLKDTLRVIVTASNAYGSASSTTATTTVAGAVAPLAYVSSFGSSLSHPCGIAVDPHGNIWVANSYANDIQKYSSSGTLLATYGTYGTGNGEYHEPVGIAVNQSTGNVYITDQNNNRVQELNEHGEWVRTWGSEGSGNGQFHEAENVAIGASGHVFVADWGNDRVQVFEENGTYLSKFGEAGSGNGQFNGPSYIAIHSGTVYVGDVNNSRIQTFSEAGAYSGQSGSWGTAVGQYEYPSGITFSPSGKLFIADGGNSRIQEWTSTFSEFLSTFGKQGTGSGQFSEPEGIAFNSSSELFIADAANDRIQKWVPPGTPRNLAAATVQGEVISGQTLTASTGTWSASPTPTYTYQWERCNVLGASCATITGATASTYTPGTADYEHTLRVAVKASNSGGSATSDSGTTAVFLRPRKTEIAYDGDGNIESVTDANGHTTKYIRNADNEPTKTEEPNGDTTETEYDGAGHVIAQIDGNRHKTKYTRNILEQITEEINPLGKKTLKEYDKAGNLEKVSDPAGRTTTMKYDPANRLTEITYSGGMHTISYEYDNDGERTKMVDGSGSTTYERDQLERPTKITDGHSESVSYEWDLDNELTKLTYPNSKTVERKYDTAGRLEKTIDWLGNTTTYTYNADSAPTTIAFPSASSEEDKTTVNNADEPTTIEMKKGSEVLASLTYTRDSDDQVISTTQHSLPGEEKTISTLDENNRLTQGGSTEYKYDAANNPTKLGTTTQTFNEADELEKAGTTSYTSAETGERTKTTPETGPATTYGYNQAGDLTSIERPEGESKPKIEDTYAYNGRGLRISEKISATTSYLTWGESEDGLPLLLSNGTYSFIYGPGNQPVEQINNTTEAVQYLHHDQQGSTRLLTSSAGAKEATFTYSPYGELIGSTGTATTPLGYDGQYTNSDTGLIYLRARSYDPKTAQFLSSDPLLYITQAPYGYADDNPMNNVDLPGLSTSSIEAVFTVICEGPSVWLERKIQKLKEKLTEEAEEIRRHHCQPGEIVIDHQCIGPPPEAPEAPPPPPPAESIEEEPPLFPLWPIPVPIPAPVPD
jgi:RHS repeat-associated protein